MKPLLDLTPEDVEALRRARRLPPLPSEATLKMSRQLAALVWDAVKRRPLPVGEGFSLPMHLDDRATAEPGGSPEPRLPRRRSHRP